MHAIGFTKIIMFPIIQPNGRSYHSLLFKPKIRYRGLVSCSLSIIQIPVLHDGVPAGVYCMKKYIVCSVINAVTAIILNA